MFTHSKSTHQSLFSFKRKRENLSKKINSTSVSSEASFTIFKSKHKIEKLALLNIPEQELHSRMTITLITARSNLNHREAWRELADASLSLLKTFVIKPDHSLLSLWLHLKRNLIDLLNTSSVLWSALKVFHRCCTVKLSNKNNTTVIVTAIKQVKLTWLKLQTSIWEYLNNQS